MPFSDFPDERELVPYEASTFAANRVVVFAPHPDDEVLGCGGALADLLDRGAHLDVVLVTDGASARLPFSGWRLVRRATPPHRCWREQESRSSSFPSPSAPTFSSTPPVFSIARSARWRRSLRRRRCAITRDS